MQKLPKKLFNFNSEPATLTLPKAPPSEEEVVQSSPDGQYNSSQTLSSGDIKDQGGREDGHQRSDNETAPPSGHHETGQ